MSPDPVLLPQSDLTMRPGSVWDELPSLLLPCIPELSVSNSTEVTTTNSKKRKSSSKTGNSSRSRNNPPKAEDEPNRKRRRKNSKKIAKGRGRGGRGRAGVNGNNNSVNTSSRANLDPVKREIHNQNERKRRHAMSEQFQYLKMAMPFVASDNRASKFTILKSALNYIGKLKEEEKDKLKQLSILREKSELLSKKLRTMKRSVIKELELNGYCN